MPLLSARYYERMLIKMKHYLSQGFETDEVYRVSMNKNKKE